LGGKRKTETMGSAGGKRDRSKKRLTSKIIPTAPLLTKKEKWANKNKSGKKSEEKNGAKKLPGKTEARGREEKTEDKEVASRQLTIREP